MLHIGDRLGLYEAMAGAGPVTSAAQAGRTGTTERYVREWLATRPTGRCAPRAEFADPFAQALRHHHRRTPAGRHGASSALSLRTPL